MASDSPEGAEPERISASESVRNWVAALVHYLELKLQLLGVESKEAGFHVLILALLFAGTVAFFGAFSLLFGVFLLYLIMRISGLEWGWSALICAGVLLGLSLVSAIILRLRITKPIFSLTRAELQKDREWLGRTKPDND
ncbi:MAG: phage holin family protein [Chthoniobacterales bacterium]|jgi:uncharacterized membrane protein YqjE